MSQATTFLKAAVASHISAEEVCLKSLERLVEEASVVGAGLPNKSDRLGFADKLVALAASLIGVATEIKEVEGVAAATNSTLPPASDGHASRSNSFATTGSSSDTSSSNCNDNSSNCKSNGNNTTTIENKSSGSPDNSSPNNSDYSRKGSSSRSTNGSNSNAQKSPAEDNNVNDSKQSNPCNSNDNYDANNANSNNSNKNSSSASNNIGSSPRNQTRNRYIDNGCFWEVPPRAPAATAVVPINSMVNSSEAWPTLAQAAASTRRGRGRGRRGL